MELLPTELLRLFSEYCSVRMAKNMTMVSKRLCSAFKPRIWRHPRFKDGYISLLTLPELSHLPILEIHTRSFWFPWWLEWTQIRSCCPFLRVMHIDDNGRNLRIQDLKEFSENSLVPVVFHTKVLDPRDVMNLDELHDLLSSLKMKGLSINHIADDGDGDQEYDLDFAWSLVQLQKFARYPLLEVKAYSLSLVSTDIEQLIEILSKNEQCKFSMEKYTMDDYGERGYEFSVEDMKKVAESGVIVPFVASQVLDHPRTVDLGKFAPVLGKLKGLYEVNIDEYELPCPPLELFTELPVRYMSLSEFEIKDGKIYNAVQVLKKMVYLEELDIYDHWSGHGITVEEFELFLDLPVKRVEISAFSRTDLSVRLHDFRRLMLQMTITTIIELDETDGSDGIAIFVRSHGENGRYKTV